VVRRLEQDARIEKAEVILDWPSRVVLRVHERTPMALVPGHGLIDRDGRLWQQDKRVAHLDLPVISGLAPETEAQVLDERLALAARLLDEAAQALPRRQVSELALGETGPVLYFEGGPGPVLLGWRQHGPKLGLLERLLQAHPEVAGRAVDLRWRGRAIVPGARKAPAPEAAAS
jgi:hypothetical protein